MDEVDRRLLDLLRDDGRLPVQGLAERLGLSRAATYARLARLRSSGAVRGFTVRVDPRALGLGLTVLVLVDVDQVRWRELHDQMLGLPGVQWLAATAGAFDFLLLVRVADADELRDVVLDRLHALEGVRSTQTVFVLDEDGPLAGA